MNYIYKLYIYKATIHNIYMYMCVYIYMYICEGHIYKIV